MDRTTVPKASIGEYCHPGPGKRKIGSGPVYSPVLAVPKASGPHSLAERGLKSCIPLPDTAHQLASLIRRQPVSRWLDWVGHQWHRHWEKARANCGSPFGTWIAGGGSPTLNG